MFLLVAKMRKKARSVYFGPEPVRPLVGSADQNLDAFFVSMRATANDLHRDEEREIGIVVAREQLRFEVRKLGDGWRLVFHYLDDILGEVIDYVKSLHAEVEELREELAKLRM